jgi:hypothetical protein
VLIHDARSLIDSSRFTWSFLPMNLMSSVGIVIALTAASSCASAQSIERSFGGGTAIGGGFKILARPWVEDSTN